MVIPKGIVTTAWPRVEAKCAELGVKFDPWQQGIGSIALGKRKDGKYAATVGGIILSIPRQVGKTFLVGMIIIALCLLHPGLTVLWTAHRTRTATKTFTTMKGITSRRRIKPFMLEPRSSNGEQEIRFVNGSVIMFGARDQGFGRGFDEVDVEVFDEAQILAEKALEDMVPAANQSRQPTGALLFFMGTPPRPTDQGEPFTRRRAKALKLKAKDAVTGVGGNAVYVEFSADDGADPDDREQWAKANPSYPERTPAESMERMREQLTDDESFAREAYGIWNPKASPRVIDEVSWEDAGEAASMAVDRLTLAIDVDPGGSVASVALAGMRADGKWHVELDDQKKGVDWVSSWVTERASKNKLHAIVVDEVSGLVTKKKNGRHYLTGTDLEVTVAAAEGKDMAIACAKFYTGVVDAKTVKHTGQPQLNVALSVARKRPLHGGWAWNRKDPNSDITPIVATTLALWGAQKDNVIRPQRAERRRVVVR